MKPKRAATYVRVSSFDQNTVYVGTAEENFNGDGYGGAGILTSTDSAAHWSQIAGPFVFNTNSGSHIGSLAVSPHNNQLILAAVLSFGERYPLEVR